MCSLVWHIKEFNDFILVYVWLYCLHFSLWYNWSLSWGMMSGMIQIYAIPYDCALSQHQPDMLCLLDSKLSYALGSISGFSTHCSTAKSGHSCANIIWFNYRSLIIYLISGKHLLPLLRVSLAIIVWLLFQMNFKMNLYNSRNNSYGIFIGIVLNL